jgi:hypothetical protein
MAVGALVEEGFAPADAVSARCERPTVDRVCLELNRCPKLLDVSNVNAGSRLLVGTVSNAARACIIGSMEVCRLTHVLAVGRTRRIYVLRKVVSGQRPVQSDRQGM